jgi:hypothetical protein
VHLRQLAALKATLSLVLASKRCGAWDVVMASGCRGLAGCIHTIAAAVRPSMSATGVGLTSLVEGVPSPQSGQSAQQVQSMRVWALNVAAVCSPMRLGAKAETAAHADMRLDGNSGRAIVGGCGVKSVAYHALYTTAADTWAGAHVLLCLQSGTDVHTLSSKEKCPHV